jgi:hypothetical protein
VGIGIADWIEFIRYLFQRRNWFTFLLTTNLFSDQPLLVEF